MKKKIFFSFLILLGISASLFLLYPSKGNFTCMLENHSGATVKDVQVVLEQGNKQILLLQHPILGSEEKMLFTKAFMNNEAIQNNSESVIKLNYKVNNKNKSFSVIPYTESLNTSSFEISFEENEGLVKTILKNTDDTSKVRVLDTEKINDSMNL